MKTKQKKTVSIVCLLVAGSSFFVIETPGAMNVRWQIQSDDAKYIYDVDGHNIADIYKIRKQPLAVRDQRFGRNSSFASCV